MKKIIMAVLTLFLFMAVVSHAKDDVETMTATVLNINGLLCAEVVEITPLKVGKNMYEVTCIEYRGGKGTVRYIMNAGEGKAWKP